MRNNNYAALFETKKAKGIAIYRLFASEAYTKRSRIWEMVWIGLFVAELWFGFYWILTQAHRWNPSHRYTFKDRLSNRYGSDLPDVDIFICTADPTAEPPLMVINTILSVMAYDYPQRKLSVYLSDDAASDVTFYALLEGAQFAKNWIPYCKEFNIEPRSPAPYFVSVSGSHDNNLAKRLASIKKLYEDMENRIETAANLGRVSKEISSKHRGFSQCNSYASRHDHDTIVQILVDGTATDIKGTELHKLVYLAREKRPQHPHDFKAGSMNALTVICTPNNSYAVLDALRFFLDKEKGHEIAFVQFPQVFENITKNDIYANSLILGREVEFHGLDGCGTRCFHRRDGLRGRRKFSEECKIEWERGNRTMRREGSVQELEENSKFLASCTYEQNTQWGKGIGLKYGFPVEDIITRLSIQCQGWKSVYFNPPRKAFIGAAPTTLPQKLVQHKRWSEVWAFKWDITITASGVQTACLHYTIPSSPLFVFLRGISLFPQWSSPWFIPYAYVIASKYTYSLMEFLWSGGTILGWWNNQRMWLYKTTSSYLFGFIDAILKSLGSFSDSAFVITAKVSELDASDRYRREIIEFGPSSSSPMFTLLATIALLNLLCLLGVLQKLVLNKDVIGQYKAIMGPAISSV
ncbi:hypothetical protein PTKIN_Ptkin14bG0009600 [Pterospermum kingtungense]